MLCIFVCFSVLILFLFLLHFLLAITKDVNTKKKHTTLKIYRNRVKFNRSIPLSCKRKKKKSYVMCNVSYICMCTLSHVHADPYSEVPRDINHKPCASSCLQRDRFVPLVFSQLRDTLHTNTCSCVCFHL